MDSTDGWRWELGNNGVCSVKSSYKKCLIIVESDFPYNEIWVPNVPCKECFFIWIATRGMILTEENLKKIKIICISW